MNQNEEPKELASETSEPSGNKRRWIIGGLIAVAAVAVLAAVLIYKSTTGTDQEKVDAALNRLDLATRGVQLDKEIGRVASSNLSKKRTLLRAEELQEKASKLRTAANGTDGAEDIVQGTDKAIRAIDHVTKLVKGIQKSETIIDSTKKQDVDQLKVNRKFLSNLADLSLGPLLASSLTSYRASIKDSIGDLEEEDSLPSQDSNEPSPQDSLTRIDDLTQKLVKVDKSPDKQIDRLIEDSKNQQYELLVSQPGTNCGETSDGEVVLLQAGEAICDQLVAVATKVQGQGNGLYSAPSGWACETPPVTPSGNVADFASGVACTDGNVTFSLFGSEETITQVDQAASKPVDPRCPPGSFWADDWRQSCITPEGDESED